MRTALITGSSGLVGSAAVEHFCALGWTVHGIDNNARAEFFGPDGDTTPNRLRLAATLKDFHHHTADVRDFNLIRSLVRSIRPDLVIHAAAQPSHDLAATMPHTDFEVNALGTLNLLEATRQYVPSSPFVFMSTNKVYGDSPNSIPLVEMSKRFEYNRVSERFGIDEHWPTDHTTHSLFGCSKLAADLYVQEYGRYFGMHTCCLRAGCLTGGNHAGTAPHGFLAYLARCVRERRAYTIHGYKGKQVRDQLHALDVARACELFAANPRAGEVYNLGGGRANSISVLEAIDAFEQATGKRLECRYEDTPRKGDHCVYYSDTRKFQGHYPEWSVSVPLTGIIEELARV